MPTNPHPATPVGLEHRPLTAKKFWQFFANLPDTPTFYTTWLSQQFSRIDRVAAGVLMLIDPRDGNLAPIAIWPDPKRDLSCLGAAAEAALQQREPVIHRPDDTDGQRSNTVHLACPLEQENLIKGVLVLDVGDRPEEQLRSILDQLQWDAGWLQSRLWQQSVEDQRLITQRSALALDMLAVVEEHQVVEQASMAVANEIAVKLDCDRVAIGLVSKGRKQGARVRLRAMSHSAWYRKKTTLVDELENAMEEALDQNATIVYPHQAFAERRITVAHKAYVENWKVKHLVSVVLTDKSVPVGVLVLERRDDKPFVEEDVRRSESIAALIGPVLDLKRRERRWFSGRIADGVRHWSHKLFGPRHPALKLLAIFLLALLAFVVVYPADFRISGDAVLEGASQRVAVAPFDGFIDQASVRAGDVVDQGALLATLDDKDLRIDALRWESERARLLQQQRQALAAKDRTETALLDAQVRQVEAQLALARQKLQRTEIRSPVSGLVIAGDLSQKLGSPVQKGETLFEIAPLEHYRVVLKVDERDIRYIDTGSRGSLLLSGMAGRALPLTVTNVTAVSEAEDGLNFFRVEAALDDGEIVVRPGMEGVGKVDVDSRSLAWIWTRTFVNWWRVFWWKWSP